MSTIDQQFVEFIVKSLVSDPDSVELKRTIDEKGVLLELTVAPDDLGRVIGKRGATAQSIRTLLRALGTKNDARYNLKIVDVGEGAHRQQSAASDDANMASASDDSDGAAASVDDNSSEDQQYSDEQQADSGLSVDGGDEQEQEDEDDSAETSFADRHRKDLDDLDDLDI